MSTCTLLLNTPKRRAGAGWLVGALAALLLTVPVVAATAQDDTGAEAERKALAEAREHIGRAEWKAAVDQLRLNIEKFPKSPQLDASLYWYAFSLKKLGMRAESMAAVERILAEHNSSRWVKDARALAIELGRSGFDDPAVRRSEDDDLKIIALQGLFDTNPQRALTISSDLVKNGSKASPALREGALMLIGQSDDPKAVDLLLDVVKNGENVGLRRSAVIGLSQKIEDRENGPADARVVAALRDLAQSSTDIEVARMALFALARDESPAGRTFIEQLATSGKSPDLRQHAILMLGQYDDDAAVDSLSRIYDANVDTEVARFAVIALSQSRRPKAAEKLMQIFKTAKDADIRRMAMMQLAEGNPEKAIEALSSAYASETEVEVKLGIIDAMAQIEDPRAMRKLIEIARAEKVHELRKRAVFWIAESDDPESGKYLEELLKAGESQALLAVIFVLMPFAMFDGVLPDQDSSATAANNSGRAGFIAVDGATLETRIELAVARGRADRTGSAYWVAYGFDIRRGVAVDFEMRNVRGVTTFDGLTIQENSKVETRNVAVFMLYEDGASLPSRVEVYNLDRKRNYGGHPVYWTGHADSGESLALLRGMVATGGDGDVTHHAVVAIGLHADPRVADILESIILG